MPVGLGEKEFSSHWLRDNTGDNISDKNPYYGEYSFYYWLWKNLLKEIENDTWIGFTGYRYHWSQNNNLNSDNLNKLINKENFGYAQSYHHLREILWYHLYFLIKLVRALTLVEEHYFLPILQSLLRSQCLGPD